MKRIFRWVMVVAALLLPMIANASLPWTQSVRYGDSVYFLYASASRIDRYDLATETMAPPVTLSCAPDAFAVDASGFYVACSNLVYAVSSDGLSQTLLVTATQPIQQLVVGTTQIYAIAQNQSWAINKTTGVTQYQPLYYAISKAVFSSLNSKIYARTTNVAPSDIVMIAVNPDGTLGGTTDSPYHGDYPSASRVWLSQDESHVLDDSGTIYDASTLNWLGALGANFDNALLTADGHILIDEGVTLSYYAANTALESFATLSNVPQSIFLYANQVYAFSPGLTDGDAPVLEKLALSAFTARSAAAVVDPTQVAYVPDVVVVGNDGVIYLLHKASKNIFRWSIVTQQYLPSIPLYDSPYAMTYSSGLDKLYIQYANGEITSIDPASLTESYFYHLAEAACGISSNNQYVYACDRSGAWSTHSVFDGSAVRIDYADWNYPSQEYVWNATNNRFYFFRDDTSPNNLQWEEVLPNGTVGSDGESPYHGAPIKVQYPIRVSANGSTILLGSGQLFNATSLSLVHTLPTPISAAIWVSGDLWTARNTDLGIFIEQWSALYSLQRTQTLPGEIAELVQFNGKVIVISKRNNTTAFTVLASDGDLDGDGVTDFIDVTPESSSNDSDNDGEPDVTDMFPHDPSESADTDGDNLGDNSDQFPTDPDVLAALDGATRQGAAGTSVAFGGDFDGDGYGDYVVGVPDYSVPAAAHHRAIQHAGQIVIISGKNGAVLVSMHGDAAGDAMGTAVVGGRDIDSDGYDDVVAGMPGADNSVDRIKNSGGIRVVYGPAGDIWVDIHGDEARSGLGSSLALGDIDGNGITDVMVGAPRADDPYAELVDAGSVSQYSIYSGRELSRWKVFFGKTAKAYAGVSVATGDVNGDGEEDVIIGAPNDAKVGSVVAYDKLRNVLLQKSGAEVGSQFGSAVASARFNGDAQWDVVVGAPNDGDVLKESGSVTVFSGSDGAQLTKQYGASAKAGLGKSVAAGDVNGDGFADIIAGAWKDDKPAIKVVKDSGSVSVWSGNGYARIGSTLYGGVARDYFGTAVSAGDINSDGKDDLIIGFPGFDVPATPTTKIIKDVGQVKVFSGAGL